MSAASFFFCWAVGTPVCLALVGLAVRLLCAVARFLERLDDAGAWPFGPR